MNLVVFSEIVSKLTETFNQNEIYEKINYYALSTPKSNEKRGKSVQFRKDASSKLPTPNLLKYSRERVSPSKHAKSRSRDRDSCDVCTPSQLGYPIAKLAMDVPVEDFNVSPFKAFGPNKIAADAANLTPSKAKYFSLENAFAVRSRSLRE